MAASSRPRVPTRPLHVRADDQRLAAVDRELDETSDSVDTAVAEIMQFVADVDSDKLDVGGIVMAPIEDDDSLVIHVGDSLRASSR